MISLAQSGQPGFTSPGTFRLRSCYSLDGLLLSQFAYPISCRHHLWGSKSRVRRLVSRAASASRRWIWPEGFHPLSTCKRLRPKPKQTQQLLRFYFSQPVPSAWVVVRHSPHSLRRDRREEGVASFQLKPLKSNEKSFLVTGAALDTYVHRCPHAEALERAPAKGPVCNWLAPGQPDPMSSDTERPDSPFLWIAPREPSQKC
jgi:hypothetical protein